MNNTTFSKLIGTNTITSTSISTGSITSLGEIGIALSSFFGGSVTVQGESVLNGLVSISSNGITGGSTSRGILSLSQLNLGSGGLYTRGLATFGGNVSIFGGRMTVNTPPIFTNGETLLTSQFGLNQYIQYNGNSTPITLPKCTTLAGQVIFFYNYTNVNMTINTNDNSLFFGSGYVNNTSVTFTPYSTPVLTNNGYNWIVIYKGS